MGIFLIFTFSLSMISKTVTYKRVPPARAWHKPTTALYNTGAFSSSKNDMIAMPVQIPICEKIFKIIFSTAQKKTLYNRRYRGHKGKCGHVKDVPLDCILSICEDLHTNAKCYHRFVHTYCCNREKRGTFLKKGLIAC